MITRSLVLAIMMGGLAAGPVFATDNTTPATAPAAASPASASSEGTNFIQHAQPGDWRASKLVGVAIYGPDNKSIGSVNDVIIGKDGALKAVVIGVGGFLGVGAKNVAVPFSAISWMDTPPVTAATNTATDTTGSIGSSPPTPAPATAPAAIAAAPGVYDYPDHGGLKMTKEQLQAAPTFTYASEK
jgi:sporulation protein YlmC with PRC-barrel domain